MNQTRIAKLFRNGAGKADRLPVELRFDESEVYAVHDKAIGKVVLSKHPGARDWDEFFALMRAIEVPEDFIAERPMNPSPVERDLLSDAE